MSLARSIEVEAPRTRSLFSDDIRASRARGAQFLMSADRSERCRELAEAGYLVARVAAPRGQGQRGAALEAGGLAEALASAVEISLALRGALPPAVEVDASTRAIAHDQLFRIRLLEAAGLCIVLPSLSPLADDGMLHPDDGEALAIYHAMAEREVVVLLFDQADSELEMMAPRSLSGVFEERGADAPVSGAKVCAPASEEALAEGDDEVPGDNPTRPWSPAAEVCADDPLAFDDRGLDVDLAEHESLGECLEEESYGSPLPSDAEALDVAFSAELTPAFHDAEQAPSADWEEDSDPGRSSFAADVALGFSEARGAAAEPSSFSQQLAVDFAEGRDSEPEPRRQAGAVARVIPRDPLDGLEVEDFDDEASWSLEDNEVCIEAPASAAPAPAAPAPAAPAPAAPAPAASAPAAPAPISPRAATVRTPPAPSLSLEEARAHCRALEVARGPKPVRNIEELFETRYCPLLEAQSQGLDDADVDEAIEEWRSSFERSYNDGFQTMRLTGKRPTMVLDVPEVAARIGRLNGARAVQLLLVDGMRFDLGLRVRDVLADQLGSTAACVEEVILWSALPTVTPVQMRLLSMGPRGLREIDPQSERDSNIQREGSVTTLRRVRIGQRDVIKLDVVEARLRDGGAGFEARMDSLAEEVGQVVASFAESLPPRTLLFVFGDHGFKLPATTTTTTGPGLQGGASPEEALVGGQAWLIGDVH